MNKLVCLKNNKFTATQWFKDGDHPEVKYWSEYYGVANGENTPQRISPGDWIVEMFDGIHLYSDEEFKRLFESCRPPADPDKNPLLFMFHVSPSGYSCDSIFTCDECPTFPHCKIRTGETRSNFPLMDGIDYTKMRG